MADIADPSTFFDVVMSVESADTDEESEVAPDILPSTEFEAITSVESVEWTCWELCEHTARFLAFLDIEDTFCVETLKCIRDIDAYWISVWLCGGAVSQKQVEGNRGIGANYLNYVCMLSQNVEGPLPCF